MRVTIDHLDVRTDERGCVFEPLERDSISAQQNVHAVISAPGAIRGNHYHLNGTETIAVKGAALVRIKENDNIYDIEVPERMVYRFVIPPKVSHAIKNTDQLANILVAFNTVEHDPIRPDAVDDILLDA